MKSNLEWLAWGKVDPLYAVATLDGKSRNDQTPWELDAFFALGVDDWRRFAPHWKAYGVEPRRCLEIGCGAGRMTRALANDFAAVVALDVSPEMIASARRHVTTPTVEFLVSNGAAVPLSDSAVEAVFSTHVFQHFDRVADGYAYFREVYRVLTPGGSAMIHLPIIVWPGGPFRRLHESLHAAQKRLGDARAAVNRGLTRLGVRKRPIMRITSYELRGLARALAEIGFAQIELRMIFGGPMAAHQACHAVVFVRKPTHAATAR